ncbi:3-hydroxyacyl-CoA dehydrogenase / enoyl-CoA hydratase / 3-hydroxybutyryl-CoA epimerase / enoyl-CoA isomerase [Azotobacter beijerinckii]|uniref:enoyl-CoA hydratase n=1 Tax=Azotobacter beijerinckii TaxID=170623 RepID=A0A1H9NZH6_9GAMM|nr:fatty acid oxidation complex subunit alpha FadB [Azotobacter beijerinckii]SER41434.1 3-hydroxyacyl-CoA dehydrogenase / enoyl-CoA hydratase / 3-hydroxybutyryl-CoA epimerase / enoyl-CoA isomerase [Azotobacter beijerinckii]
MYNGKAMRLTALEAGLVELTLDLQGSSVNKLDGLTLGELAEVVRLLERHGHEIEGLLIASAKPAFVVGADITEFTAAFARSESEVVEWIRQGQLLFGALEALPFPSVAAVNGLALGGGCELALAADFRILAADARIGLPEVTLGLCPGWGGTVRLSRLIGVEAALDWMLAGKPQAAGKALELGAVDRVVAGAELRDAALSLLRLAASGELSTAANRVRKQQPLADTAETREWLVAVQRHHAGKLDPHYPAPAAILDAVVRQALLPLDRALDSEAHTFAALAKSDVARALVGLFLGDQLVRKKAKAWSGKAAPVRRSAVLGAGIMGGGVAFQSASTGTPIVMKDIRGEALELGLKTANQLLDRQIDKGRLDAAGKQRVLENIHPALDYRDFAGVDLVVEAVVENPKIKAAVLAEVEDQVPADAVLTSNTSTISIDLLAQGLKRPESFCGMHFFNPVQLMQLVEVIRGSRTSEATIARTVAYASAMGKTPIVVGDCPGFLVNRVLFPYFNGFNRLLRDGVDFERIDRVMEAFGWPMGPAYLADVIGIDTMVHADRVLQEGFPERMGHDGEPIMDALLASGALGQKNGKGFYEYTQDASGRRSRQPAAAARALIAARVPERVEVSDEEIVDRLMIPLCLEAVRCLEDGIVETPEEIDMGLLLGIGFPRFRGGALRYLDTQGLAVFARKAEAHARHGGLYRLTEDFRARLQAGRSYF